MYRFNCYACKRQSRYFNHHTEMVMEMVTRAANDMRTRTYQCEFCGRDNEIDHTSSEWFAIDGALDTEDQDGIERGGGI